MFRKPLSIICQLLTKTVQVIFFKRDVGAFDVLNFTKSSDLLAFSFAERIQAVWYPQVWLTPSVICEVNILYGYTFSVVAKYWAKRDYSYPEFD